MDFAREYLVGVSPDFVVCEAPGGTVGPDSSGQPEDSIANPRAAEGERTGS